MIGPWMWIALLAVVFIVVLLFLVVGFARLRLHITLDDEFNLRVRSLWLHFNLADSQEEQPETKPCKNPEHVLRRELRRVRREELRAEKKARRAQKRQAKQKAAPAPEAPKKLPLNLPERIALIGAIVKRFYELTSGRIKIRIKKLHVTVSTDDAAKTAILYGAVCEATSLLLELINDGYTPVQYKAGAVAVVPDYVSGKCDAKIDVVCSVSLVRAFVILGSLVESHRVESARAQKKARRRIEKKAAKKAAKQRKTA